MKKIIFIVLTVFIFSVLSSEAALYKGQRIYAKKCMTCHKTGEAFIAKKTKRQWKKLMKKKGKKLANLHLKSKKFKKYKKVKKYKKAKKYFKGKKFTKKSKHLRQFLIEYAKDSGNVPACN